MESHAVNLATAIRKMGLTVEDVMERVCRILNAIASFADDMEEVREAIERERRLRASWTVCRDDRRPHQVFDRRPAFRPRKLL